MINLLWSGLLLAIRHVSLLLDDWMFIQVLLGAVLEEELCQGFDQLDSFCLESFFSEDAFKCVLEVTAHYKTFEEGKVLSSHHFDQFEENCELFKVYLLLIVFGLECVSLDHSVLEETEITEGVEVQLGQLVLLEPVTIAAIDA